MFLFWRRYRRPNQLLGDACFGQVLNADFIRVAARDLRCAEQNIPEEQQIADLGLIETGYGQITLPEPGKMRDWVDRHCRELL